MVMPREAEVAGEWFLREHMACTATRRVRRGFAAQDFFGADVVGKRSDGAHVYAQVSKGSSGAIAARRRKLEAYAWHGSDLVLVLELRTSKDPVDRSRHVYHFRVHDYKRVLSVEVEGAAEVVGSWIVHDDAVPVPREWFMSRRARGRATA